VGDTKMNILITTISILGVAGCLYVLYSILIKVVARDIKKELNKG
jgi:uncharacterized protein with PQ loop repeat